MVLRFPLLLLLLYPCLSSGGQPRFFGFGRTPTAQEIRRWNIDIMPDGKQLPQGSGTVASGKKIYQAKCVSCHGPGGKGGPNTQLAGAYNAAINFATDTKAVRTIGNYWPYATTIFDYINRAMPQNAPGSLTTNEVYSLTAYLLYINKIIDKDMKIDRHSLPRVIMPARHLFYWSDEVKHLQPAATK